VPYTGKTRLWRYRRRLDAPAPRDEDAALAVTDFLLRLAEVLLEGGAPTVDVESSVIAAGSALGVPRVDVDITFNAVTVTVLREDGVPPITRIRVVRGRTGDYSRLAAAHNLVVDLVEERVDRGQALARLTEIEAQPSPYPRWVITAAWGALAAAVTQLLGGSWPAAGIAFATTALVDRLGRRLSRRGWPQFFLNTVGGLCATLVAVALTALDVPVHPSLVVAGGIIVLLSGVGIVTTVQDAITGFVVTAAGRTVEVVLLTAGIISGVAMGLLIARRLGIPMSVQPVQVPVAEFPLRTVAAGIGAAAFAVAYRAPRRLLPAAAALGALGYAVSAGLLFVLLEAPAAAAGAAAAVGVAGHVLALRKKAPPLALVVPAIVPLLPGLTIYHGMLLLSDGSSADGLLTLLQAATTALALAAGVILGEIAGQPVRRELGRVERRLTARQRLVRSNTRRRRARSRHSPTDES
jgi:uncharacterized membrane protein YjjP (DUF1212 family)